MAEVQGERYQIGAWKALVEAGVKVNAVAGTSVGALNGAFDLHGRCKAGGKKSGVR